MALRDAPGLRPQGAGEEPGDALPAGVVALPDDGDEIELPPQPEGEQFDVDVLEAIRRCRRDIGIIRKKGEYKQGNTKFNFRGIDQVVNATRPVLDRHGLVLIPSVVEFQCRDVERQGGGRSHETLLLMEFWVYGPRGDFLEHPVRTMGEALNTSDKDAAAAMSVAWREALIKLFHIASGDPDPDSQYIERGEARFDATAYREEALRPTTSVGRLQQMMNEVRSLGKGGVLVENEIGDEESIEHLLWRVRKERMGSNE